MARSLSLNDGSQRYQEIYPITIDVRLLTVLTHHNHLLLIGSWGFARLSATPASMV
ncbi:MAG: hypothetical protein QS721_08585 [Candidatus Endonucleobacter sp. (ex Gigantidas childressi)]|nr:hypothetical protein [Candidatus Endonucleobacter sp. (ex Gigantidas childressi)]